MTFSGTKYPFPFRNSRWATVASLAHKIPVPMKVLLPLNSNAPSLFQPFGRELDLGCARLSACDWATNCSPFQWTFGGHLTVVFCQSEWLTVLPLRAQVQDHEANSFMGNGDPSLFIISIVGFKGTPFDFFTCPVMVASLSPLRKNDTSSFSVLVAPPLFHERILAWRPFYSPTSLFYSAFQSFLMNAHSSSLPQHFLLWMHQNVVFFIGYQLFTKISAIFLRGPTPRHVPPLPSFRTWNFVFLEDPAFLMEYSVASLHSLLTPPSLFSEM